MGQYIMKSAYNVLRDNSMDANVGNKKSFWTRLWHLKILLKVKHFMWRVICDCLPTKDRLLSKWVEVDSKCPVCNLIDETSLHALGFCPVAALCCQLQGVRFDSAAINNTTDWVQEIYQHSGRSEVNKIFMIALMIWNNRNDVVWKQKGRGAKSSCRQGCVNPEMAEAIGIREALSWVKEHNWPQVVVESDCLGAIQANSCSSISLSYLGRIIDECKRLLLELKSRNATLRFVKRSANMVAHF
ncbi:uncharacterized protein LOC141685372 [Apium graveolens]|uniref:uncharacterized protein LOC141685372 n=1 Tax=Apium graveolens TaxID=4045 RepID=UPI003D790632